MPSNVLRKTHRVAQVSGTAKKLGTRKFVKGHLKICNDSQLPIYSLRLRSAFHDKAKKIDSDAQRLAIRRVAQRSIASLDTSQQKCKNDVTVKNKMHHTRVSRVFFCLIKLMM